MDLTSVVDYSLPAAMTAGAAYKWVVFRKAKEAWEDGRTDLAVGVIKGFSGPLVSSATGRVDPAVVEELERLGSKARDLDTYSIRSNDLDARVGLILSGVGLVLLAPSAYWAASAPDFYSIFRFTMVSVFVAATVRTVRRARSEVRRLIVKDVMES